MENLTEKIMEQIIDLFFKNAYKNPTKCAIWCDGKTVSYEELALMVNAFANLFLESGIQYKEHIGFPMNNSIESVAIMLAAAEIGCALVPINTTLPKDAIENSFYYGNVKHIIAKSNFYKQYREWDLREISGVKICIDKEYEDCISLTSSVPTSDRVNIKKTGEELFIITMTSGSTGNPKPIALTQNNKLQRAKTHIEHYNLKEKDKILAATPLYHSLAERLVLMPLMLGATSILLPRFTPNKWLKCVEEQQVTFTIAVSAQLGQIAELLSSSCAPKIRSLRCIVSSSALLEPDIRDSLINKLDCDFHEMYGTSEISTATDINFKEAVQKQNSVGKQLEGVDIIIRKENGEKCDVGEIGEISCKTKLVCSGYYGMQEAFDNACIEGYFKTGDLGYLDKDGYLYYSGRKKEIIITGGINVFPMDVEACIIKLDGVKECAAFSYPDERLGEVVGVAIVKAENSNIDLRMVQVQCARNLADYQQPHKIFFVDELPKNTMGKLVRAKILENIKKEMRN